MFMKRMPSPERPVKSVPAAIINQVNEMKGFYELGMGKEALKIVRLLLKYRPVHPFVFKEAVQTILVQADYCRTWRRSVEKAYVQSSNRNRRTLRPDMLRFYISLWDYRSALKFIPKRPENIGDLVFSLWTFLELKMMDQAKPLWRKCRGLLGRVDDRFDRAMLIDALAQYHAQIGELGAAEDYWIHAPEEEPFFENAARGLVKIEAIRGQFYVMAGELSFEHMRPEANRELDLVIPANSKARMSDVLKDLKRYSAALYRVVPEKELWRFGVTGDQ
jgi:tetratricopeptide (TPR) repeat protein